MFVSFLQTFRRYYDIVGVEVSSVSWLGKLTINCRDNDGRPTGKKNISIEWDDDGK